ncbi:MAG: DegV family protein [Erysipelotrichaceae bacterium]|nr:DegV family protein [Erysipelotrichaceae bacterium]
MKIAFLTDSGTGKNIQELEKKGIFSVPLQISYDTINAQDLEDMNIDEVYAYMREGKLLSTSLPSLGNIESTMQKIKNAGYEMIFAVPICTGLSGTTNAMQVCAKQLDIPFEYVDCHVTAVVQEYLITLAKTLYEQGMAIDVVKEKLEKIIQTTNTILLPNDLHNLKRGGRLTPLAATLGGLLKIKPILRINQETSGKIDVVSKVRTMHKAMDEVIAIMKKEGVDETYSITVAHADDVEEANVYMEKIKEAFPHTELQMIKLVSVVGVHTGIGCQAVQYFKKYDGN